MPKHTSWLNQVESYSPRSVSRKFEPPTKDSRRIFLIELSQYQSGTPESSA